MTSSQTYLLGFIILILGIAFGAYMLGAPMLWIGIGAVVMIGLGIMASSSRTRSGQV